MQPWLRPTSPGQDDVSNAVDGLSFVLEHNGAERVCASSSVNGQRASKTVTLSGQVQPESWCRLGTQVLPKLSQGRHVRIGVEISATVEAGQADAPGS